MSGKRFFLAIAALLGVLVLGQHTRAWAGSTQTIEDASAQEVVDAMAHKAVRGIANTTTGWLEFPMQIYLTIKNEGVTKGLTVGPLKGLGMTLVRTVTGAAETTTFFLAYPGFYDPYFEPEFAWEEE